MSRRGTTTTTTQTVSELINATCMLKSNDLNISNKGLADIPNELTQVTERHMLPIPLKKLNLSNNQIQRMSPSIKLHDSLVDLNLSFNKLKSLPDEITCLVSLQCLNLRGNDFRELPKAALGLPQLTQLDLSRNFLVSLPETIGQAYPNVQFLDISRNNLKSLPHSMSGCSALSSLTLDSNPFGMVPDVVLYLTNLRYLSCKSIGATRVPNAMDNLVSLESLILDDNPGIVSVPICMSELALLQRLSLNGECVIPPEAKNGGAAQIDKYLRFIAKHKLEFDWKGHWAVDKEVKSCGKCKDSFSFTTRRHHCRFCGNIFCSKCSKESIKYDIIDFGEREIKVCDPCFTFLGGEVSQGRNRASSRMRKRPTTSGLGSGSQESSPTQDSRPVSAIPAAASTVVAPQKKKKLPKVYALAPEEDTSLVGVERKQRLEAILATLKEDLHKGFKTKKSVAALMGNYTDEAAKANIKEQISEIEEEIAAMKASKKKLIAEIDAVKAGAASEEPAPPPRSSQPDYPQAVPDYAHGVPDFAVDIQPPPPTSPPPTDYPTAQALYSYEPVNDTELGVIGGEMLTVTDQSDPDWSYVINSEGREGYLPTTYIAIV
eukprot:TRINITY_DN8779_c0_g1_i1.p1 TRINITY_DN8779_c0_g1~~TRINITY_DN8779_c0_g1_i1.p1  ORF type:complete len:603 (+),score=105.86 TRINITY_DN8779_c0_g1_i1:185-1993(+)